MGLVQKIKRHHTMIREKLGLEVNGRVLLDSTDVERSKLLELKWIKS